jgi:PAS domain S-box-containing protein
MKDYTRMTKAELIGRMRQLEQEFTPQALVPGQVRAEAALHEAEQRLRAILETAVEGIITINERGIIESLNRAAERVFGYAASEVVGSNVSVLMPSPFREEHDGYIANYQRTGRARIIGIGREVKGQRKDGTVFPMDLSVSEVRLPGRLIFTGFVRDITERKRGELRQQVQYAVARVLAEVGSLSAAAPQLMASICNTMDWNFGEFWSVDRQANVVHHVQSWYPNSVGHPEFETLAGRVSCVRNEGLPGRVWARGTAEWLTDLSADSGFLRGRAAEQAGVRAAIAFPILLGSEVLGVMVFFSCDSTRQDPELLELFRSIGSQIGQFIERKRAETKLAEVVRTLAEKNKELETVVYVASHDLRSPLVNIQGFSRELLRACDIVRTRVGQNAEALKTTEVRLLLSDEIPEAISFILAGVKKMDSLLSGFLRFSRLGRAALKIERLDMRRVMAEIAQAMDFQLKQSGARLEIGALPECWGDAMQTNQVFSNLLDNAIKYLDRSRTGQIYVSGQTEDGRAIYAVRDNGIGIAPEHQSKVFEIFHRLNPGVGEGEGLGLTIAQRILERQSGQIWVESTVGEGSTFFVSLPT